jgi:hypothetical protein
MRDSFLLTATADDSEATMRKNTSFAVAATVMGLVMVFWAKASVVASSADVRPKAAASFTFVTSAAYLPFQVAQPVW